ncbi:MATE family efflux transporter [Akkermansiaceae bacterium]|nr:MATE family efflux transporter [Akkermansiaceae bacterium]MDA7888800.1 MATE family efflux transporter [Akkermansiaceae bacterium]
MVSGLSIPALLKEGKKTAILSIPIIIGQISQMLMVITDTVMVGKVGVTELAALTFASSIFAVPFVFGIGLITSVSILSSGAVGRKDAAEARAVCRNGFFLALGAGCLLATLSCSIIPFLTIFDQPEEVTALAPPYLALVLISIIPILSSLALKNHSDSLDRTWPGFFIFLGAVLLNVVLNQLFIFELGYGLTGAGWATLISRIAILIMMLLWFKKTKDIADLVPRRWLRKPNPTTIRKLLTLGIPASFHLLAEVGAFSTAAILVGYWGEVALAAHQVAITTAGTVFMVPLGLSIALTMRMGKAFGAKETSRFLPIILSGWLITISFIAITALTCWLGNEFIAERFVKNNEVVALAAKFLIIVAFFQLFDGLQVVSAGYLRGLEDVKVPAWTAFIAYWIFGIPIGWLLATTGGLDASGIWWGLAIGLALAAIFLSARVIQMERRLSARAETT